MFMLGTFYSKLNKFVYRSVRYFFASMPKKYLLYCKSEFRTKTKNKERQWNKLN